MKLIIVSWPPCSGKSTYIKNNCSNLNIISTDKEISLIKEKKEKLGKVKLNQLWLDASYKKIELNISKNIDSVYDSTNLNKSRREKIIKLCKNKWVEIIWINILTSFDTIYSNWEKRGKDIEIEIVFFLYSIYEKIEKNEWFNDVIDIKYEWVKNLRYLKSFINNEKYNQEKILEENKDLYFLNNFWKKAWKDYINEYNKKISYLEELYIEDRLAILYSEIKYFYQDFISNINITYNVKYNDFIELFFKNILKKKILKMWLNTDKTYKSFKKIIDIF